MSAPNILIIEDEDELRCELVELFCALGATATGVHDGRSASFACQSQAFDLVLCDYKLRVDNGLQVLKSIVAQYHEVAVPSVYLMTGHLDLTMAARAEIETSTDGLLMKPLSAAVLRDLMAKAGAQIC